MKYRLDVYKLDEFLFKMSKSLTEIMDDMIFFLNADKCVLW